MDYELKERITQIRNALVLIDIFDSRKEAEFNAMGEEVKQRIKKYEI